MFFYRLRRAHFLFMASIPYLPYRCIDDHSSSLQEIDNLFYDKEYFAFEKSIFRQWTGVRSDNLHLFDM